MLVEDREDGAAGLIFGRIGRKGNHLAGFASPKYEWEIEDSGLSKERVSVAWGDAKATTGKTKLSPREAKKQGLSPQETIGFLVKKTSKVIGVASERDGEGDGFRQVTFIPRKTVSSIRRLNMDHGGFKEPYMHESGKSGGKMELNRVVIEEADNEGFIVSLEYEMPRNGKEPMTYGHEEVKKVFSSPGDLLAFLGEMYEEHDDEDS